jgi:hypothetical protein
MWNVAPLPSLSYPSFLPHFKAGFNLRTGSTNSATTAVYSACRKNLVNFHTIKLTWKTYKNENWEDGEDMPEPAHLSPALFAVGGHLLSSLTSHHVYKTGSRVWMSLFLCYRGGGFCLKFHGHRILDTIDMILTSLGRKWLRRFYNQWKRTPPLCACSLL